MNKDYKEQILKLRESGKSYREIKEITGASKGTICYHCGKGQKEKYKNRLIKYRDKIHPYKRKLEAFQREKLHLKKNIRKTYKNIKLLKSKIVSFHTDRKTREVSPMLFNAEDLINKFGENPKCYLTGQRIDIYKPRTYQFDHINPVSKGGDNSLENLGICTRNANMAKSDMTLEEFYKLCEDVVNNKKMVQSGNAPD